MGAAVVAAGARWRAAALLFLLSIAVAMHILSLRAAPGAGRESGRHGSAASRGCFALGAVSRSDLGHVIEVEEIVVLAALLVEGVGLVHADCAKRKSTCQVPRRSRHATQQQPNARM